MLKGNSQPVDLIEIRDSLMAQSEKGLSSLEQQHGLAALQRLYDQTVVEINFPVLQFPQKVKSFNLDKQPVVEGVLQGIKGQYLILDTGVINIRKYTAYNVQFSAWLKDIASERCDAADHISQELQSSRFFNRQYRSGVRFT